MLSSIGFGIYELAIDGANSEGGEDIWYGIEGVPWEMITISFFKKGSNYITNIPIVYYLCEFYEDSSL